MIDLLNVPNPDEKIKMIVNEAILKKRAVIEQANNELEDLKRQEASGIYYSPMDGKSGSESDAKTDTKSTMTYVTVAILSIINDVLHGFQAATKYMKNTAIAVETERNGRNGRNDSQMGGKARGYTDTDSIKKQADVLTKLIGGANEQIKKLTASNATASNATASNPIDSNASIGNVSRDLSVSTLGDESKELAIKAFTVMKDIGEVGLKTGIKWTGDVTGEANLLDTPLDELSPELNKKVLLLAGVLKELSTNPATKEAVKEIAQAVAVTMIEILKEIRPQVNKVADQGTEMLQEVSEKFVSGATSTGISVIQAFIAEIPWVGGIVDLFIAIGKGFNTLTRTFKVFMEKSGPMVITSAQTIKDTEATAVKGKERILGAVDNAANTLKDANTNASTNASANTDSITSSPMTGGKYNMKPVHSKIQNGGKRLRKTMKMFHTTLPKLTFTSANKPHKGYGSRKSSRSDDKKTRKRR
jgi:hypothetical protein